MILKYLFLCNLFLSLFFFPFLPPPAPNKFPIPSTSGHSKMFWSTSNHIYLCVWNCLFLNWTGWRTFESGMCLQNLSFLQFLAYVNFNKDRLSMLKTTILVYFSAMYVDIIHAFPLLEVKFSTWTWNCNIVLLTEIEMNVS